MRRDEEEELPGGKENGDGGDGGVVDDDGGDVESAMSGGKLRVVEDCVVDVVDGDWEVLD